MSLKIMKLDAKIKTTTNFRNLNGTWLVVNEIVGNRVSCDFFDEEANRQIVIDFNMREIEEFSYYQVNKER